MPDLRIDVKSTSDTRGLSTTRREVDRFGSSVDTAGKNSERSRGKVSRFGGAVGGAAKAFAPLAAAAAGAAVLKFGADSVSAASDVQQSFGAVETVFGRNAATVKRWANGAASSVGLAKSEYASMAAVLGAALKNSGIENYTGKTDQLIKKGADLAATFGGSTSEAVEALGSLLRGETDPIERYGISLKQSDVNARLAANGQAKLTGKARAQAEMQARLQIVTEKSKDSVGAFRRESSTLAGQQQRLKARFENLKATLGQRLIPIVSKVLQFFNRLLSGQSKTGGAAKKMAAIYGSYVRPIFNAVRGAVDRVKTAFDKSGGSAKGLGTIAKVLGKIAGFVAKVMGGQLARGINVAAYAIGAAAGVASRLADMLSRVWNWAGAAADKIGSLASKAKGIGSLGGLLRTGGDVGGLARARGLSPQLARLSQRAQTNVNLTSSPSVVIDIDSPALAKMFRVIVKDELRQHARAGEAVV